MQQQLMFQTHAHWTYMTRFFAFYLAWLHLRNWKSGHCLLHKESSKATAPLGFFLIPLHWTESGMGCIRLQPDKLICSCFWGCHQTLIQMHAVVLQFHNQPDSHWTFSLPVLFPLKSVPFSCLRCFSVIPDVNGLIISWCFSMILIILLNPIVMFLFSVGFDCSSCSNTCICLQHHIILQNFVHICLHNKDRSVKTHCCQGQQTMVHVEMVKWIFTPCPTLPLVLTKYIVDRWLNEAAGKQLEPGKVVGVLSCAFSWGAKVLLSRLLESCWALPTRVAPIHWCTFHTVFSQPRPRVNQCLWPFVQTCFSFESLRVRPVGCWFIPANIVDRKKHIICILRSKYLSAMLLNRENQSQWLSPSSFLPSLGWLSAAESPL